MKPLTYNVKRSIVVVAMAVLLFASANRFLEWGLFGRADRPLFSIAFFVLLIVMAIFRPSMDEEALKNADAKREAEEIAERVRDKSHDAEDIARLRKAIGMPPDKSM